MSAEHLKQLRIKTKILMRLRKEYQSYQKETLGFENKQHKLEEELHLGANKEELELQLTKNREFLTESQVVLSNVKQKLIEAFEGLTQFLIEKGQEEGVVESEEKKAAEELVLQTETFLQSLQ